MDSTVMKNITHNLRIQMSPIESPKKAIILFCLLMIHSLLVHGQEIENALMPIANFDQTNFESIKDAIGESQIVLIGEQNHDHGNVFAAKIELVKYLHEVLDFDILAFESGFYDLNKAKYEFQNNPGVELLSEAIFPIWTGTSDFRPLMDYLVYQKDSLTFAGFDSQFSGEYSLENMEEEFDSLVAGQVSADQFKIWLDGLYQMIELYTFSTDTVKFRNFAEAHSIIAAAVNETGKGQLSYYRMLLENIIVMARFYHQRGEITKENWKAEDSNVRDQLMAQNLIWLIKANPGKKIMCWGANAHFANKIWMLDDPKVKNFVTMGSHLKDSLGSNLVYHLAFAPADKNSSWSKNSIEYLFLQKKSPFAFLDLTSCSDTVAFSSQMLSREDTSFYGTWKNVVDGLVLLDTAILSKNHVDAPIIGTTSATNQFTYKSIIGDRGRSVSTYALQNGISKGHQLYKGQIVDKQSNEGLPFVNIGIRGTLIGTASNAEGYFKLKIPKNMNLDSLEISCVGYQTQKIAVSEMESRQPIKLTESIETLGEIEVNAKKVTAMEVMKRVIGRIEENYLQTPYTQTMLYRSDYIDGNNNIYKQKEVIREEYDDNGYQSVSLYPIRYEGFYKTLMGRQGKSDRDSYEDFPDLYLVPTAISDIVDVRNNNFLSPSKVKKYELEFEDAGQEGYIHIKFRNKKPNHRNSTQLGPVHYYGVIRINEEDDAIMEVMSTTIVDKSKIWRAEQYKTYETEDIWFVKEKVTYKKVDGHYYLAYLERVSNWDQYIYGSVKVFGLDVKPGFREKSTSTRQSTIPYQLDIWNSYTNGTTAN